MTTLVVPYFRWPFLIASVLIIVTEFRWRSCLTVTRRVSHVEQELLTLPEHPCLLPDFRGLRVARSLGFCVMFYGSLFVLLSYFVWSLCCLVLRFTASDYPFDIYKFFLAPLVRYIPSLRNRFQPETANRRTDNGMNERKWKQEKYWSTKHLTQKTKNWVIKTQKYRAGT